MPSADAGGADFTAVVFSVCSVFAVGDVAGVTVNTGLAGTVSTWRRHGAAPSTYVRNTVTAPTWHQLGTKMALHGSDTALRTHFVLTWR